MTETPSINCPACGGPNSPEAGTTYMACTYCCTNITIPSHLRTKAIPKAEKMPSKAKPVASLELDAPDLLRKAQPVAIGAWNLYALWTRLRWIVPTCLTILIIGFFACAALGALPFVLSLSR